MFLNWVYRRLQLGGFDNVGELTNVMATDNDAGEDRFDWFEENLQLFFGYYGW